MNDAKRSLLIASLAAASVIVLIVIYFVPIWWVALTAPNYPEAAFPDGVRIDFHMNGVFNGCSVVVKDEIQEDEALDCVHEMDTINHYVGMYPIAAGGPIERGFSPFLITFLITMIIGFVITNPKKRMFFLIVAFAINAGWMAKTIYTSDGLSYQNEGYLYALMNQLDQDVGDTDTALGDDVEEPMESAPALKKLRDSLAGREVEEEDEEPETLVKKESTASKTRSEKQRLIAELKSTYDNDLQNGRVADEWAGNGYQLMAWHYGKVLGRYFNNPEEIQPMVKTLKLATNIVFIGLVGAMLLLIFGAWANNAFLYWLMILVPMALPVFFIIDYAAWLWWYGHTLNDMGAFAVKPFMPTVFGVGKVAQFSTYSYPSIGFGLMMLSSALLAVAALLRRQEA